jgi:hypothetical protein
MPGAGEGAMERKPRRFAVLPPTPEDAAEYISERRFRKDASVLPSRGDANGRERAIFSGIAAAGLKDSKAVLDSNPAKPIVGGMLCDKVFDGGEHAVARTALVGRIAELRVPASGINEGAPSAENAFALKRKTMPGGDSFRLIVHIAPAIGPLDVVEEDHASGAEQTSFPDHVQLVEDRVPVMVSVDEETIVRSLQFRKRLKAEVAEDGDALIASVLGSQVGVEAGVDDGM